MEEKHPTPADQPVPDPVSPAPPAGDARTGEGAPGPAAPADGFHVEISGSEALTGPIVESIKTVYDPEIPVNVYELGLIYEIHVDEAGKARVVFTLTSPHCPAAQAIPAEIETKVRGIEGVVEAQLDLVWDPPWGPERMSEVAQLTLGIT